MTSRTVLVGLGLGLAATLLGVSAVAQAPASCVGAASACVVSTFPADGATVRPGPTVLKVRFDRPMRPDGFSITDAPGGAPPPVAGRPRFLTDGQTFELPLSLLPGTTYALSINSETHRNFRGQDGAPAIPHRLVFRTVR